MLIRLMANKKADITDREAYGYSKGKCIDYVCNNTLIRKQDFPHTLRYRATSGIDCRTCDDKT